MKVLKIFPAPNYGRKEVREHTINFICQSFRSLMRLYLNHMTISIQQLTQLVVSLTNLELLDIRRTEIIIDENENLLQIHDLSNAIAGSKLKVFFWDGLNDKVLRCIRQNNIILENLCVDVYIRDPLLQQLQALIQLKPDVNCFSESYQLVLKSLTLLPHEESTLTQIFQLLIQNGLFYNRYSHKFQSNLLLTTIRLGYIQLTELLLRNEALHIECTVFEFPMNTFLYAIREKVSDEMFDLLCQWNLHNLPSKSCVPICQLTAMGQIHQIRKLLQLGVTVWNCKIHESFLLRNMNIWRELLDQYGLREIGTPLITIYHGIQYAIIQQDIRSAVYLISKVDMQELLANEFDYLELPLDQVQQRHTAYMRKPLIILAIERLHRETQDRFIYQDFIKDLLESGVKMEITDQHGWTPLITAASYGDVEIVKTLLDLGALVDKSDQYGKTALHQACQNGHVEVVRMLIQYGANTRMSCKLRKRPISYAIGMNKDEIRKILLSSKQQLYF